LPVNEHKIVSKNLHSRIKSVIFSRKVFPTMDFFNRLHSFSDDKKFSLRMIQKMRSKEMLMIKLLKLKNEMKPSSEVFSNHEAKRKYEILHLKDRVLGQGII
jgi:hypothetical protein